MRLDPTEFDNWFRELNGDAPFPWQRRLFSDWLCPPDPDDARWPRLLQLPTASGKTAVMDLAVLALAAGSACARRRIIFVVDRRVVVDEAARRAHAIADRLRDAATRHDDPLNPVASALLSLGGESPLAVATLRGGIVPDDGWARTPAQPAVILSTVDQTGSRLLFRAYGGHGPRSWPIHAGLVGRDALVIVDEAHCAVPFCQTIGSIADRWQRMAQHEIGAGIQLVQMSATPGGRADFVLDEVDRADTTLRRRLTAAKPAALIEVPDKTKNHRQSLVRDTVKRARESLDSMTDGVVGIIVNRVADAREIFNRLELGTDRKLLLTGRVRGWERDRLIAEWLPRIRAGHRADVAGPVAVVSTQCIEVGANLDFDVLLTEIAPLDALRQRFGRLNRLGLRADAAACVLAATAQILSKDGAALAPDPVYGSALANTWAWLWAESDAGQRHVDFGIDALDSILPDSDALAPICQETKSAYALLPAHLDLLAQTSPPPAADPEIAAFLHGTVDVPADITVVWRSDLDANDPRAWVDRVAVQPPTPGEGCPVPAWEVQRWLARNGGASLDATASDLESAPSLAPDDAGGQTVLRWLGSDESEVTRAARVRRGDTIVIPSAYGGCDAYGFAPNSQVPVMDIGDAVALAAGRRPVIRLGSLAQSLAEGTWPDGPGLVAAASAWCEGDDDAAPIQDTLNHMANASEAPAWLRAASRALAADRRRAVIDAAGAFALAGRRASGEDSSSADDRSSHGVEVTLADHSAGVRNLARRFALDSGASEALADDIGLAGWLHDVGKADPRFQAWLRDGDPIAVAMADSLLAKSGRTPRDRGAISRARARSGYPLGARHELQSLDLVQAEQDLLAGAHDPDLVLFLIASHHGYARPFAPVAFDPDTVDVELAHGDVQMTGTSGHGLHRLDAGVPERFWRLVRRYGWWGLAWTEAILRLADHRRSEAEQND